MYAFLKNTCIEWATNAPSRAAVAASAKCNYK